MTHRSRNGGPPKTHRKPKQRDGQRRKLHHPPPLQRNTESVTEHNVRPPHPLSTLPEDADILSLLRTALKDTLDSDDFIATVQKIKGLLYDKRWLEVFEDPELLDAYAGRWVPSRVLCFRELFVNLDAVREALVGDAGEDAEGEEETVAEEDDDSVDEQGDESGEEHDVDTQAVKIEGLDMDLARLSISSREPVASSSRTRLLSLGGGAGSEMLAFGSIVHGARLSRQRTDSADRKGKGKAQTGTEQGVYFVGADIGAWAGVLQKFAGALDSLWSLSPRTRTFEHDYIRTNLLESLTPLTTATTTSAADASANAAEIRSAVSRSNIITLLFTLTELFTQSRVMAVRLLRSLTAHARPGTLFLVADSASDISEFEIGSSGRKWPVYYILDTVMLGQAAFAQPAPAAGNRDKDDDDTDGESEEDSDEEDDGGKSRPKRRSPAKKVGTDWELLDESDSRWFRLAPTVAANWPVKLENTRYWFRLYRKR